MSSLDRLQLNAECAHTVPEHHGTSFCVFCLQTKLFFHVIQPLCVPGLRSNANRRTKRAVVSAPRLIPDAGPGCTSSPLSIAIMGVHVDEETN